METQPVHEYPVTIRELHLDTFGHVNNAQYLALFEEARWQVITERGYGMKEIAQNKIGPVILECKIRFLKELKLREKIVIQTFSVKPQGKIITIKQTMLNEKRESACEAEFVTALFDLKSRKIIEPTKEWLRAIGCE